MKKIFINLLVFILLVISADYIFFKIITFKHKKECISKGLYLPTIYFLKL